MKIKLLFLSLLFCSMKQANAQDCSNPISGVVFQAYYAQIATQPTNETRKTMAMTYLNNSCWLSSYIKSTCQLFTDDAFKLDFAQAAYSHCYDRTNFYDVYDAFSKFSSAMRLHDLIGAGNSNTPPPPPPPPTINFPNWNYPNPAVYNGKKGCPGPVISNETFMEEAMTVSQQASDDLKMQATQISSESHCMSMAMYMKMVSLIKDETARYTAMTNYYPLIYDIQNYVNANVLFTNAAVKATWINFCKAYLDPPPPCITTDADLKKIDEDMKAKPFGDDKMKIWDLASKDRCFNVEQIRIISKQFPFGEAKMKVFKGSYAKCTNRADYYKLVDELTFSVEKDDLRNYIKNN